MIRTFASKGLAELWSTGTSRRINAAFHKRIFVRLDALDAAIRPADMAVPGFNYHALAGFSPTRYSVHVNGPWCITFEFDGEDATNVDFEQYH